MTGVSQARRGHTLQISRNFAEIVLRSAKEASGKAATSSRQKHEELRLQLTASGLGTGVRLASSRTRGLASSATEKSACSRKHTSRQSAARGSTELPGRGNTPAGIRRARRPGPIRRPLCCERATDPARSWPRGRERENYERKNQKS